MVSNTAEVLAAALQLPRDDRSTVVEELMRSLDQDDELSSSERDKLHAAIARSDEQFRAGRGIPAERAFERLSKR